VSVTGVVRFVVNDPVGLEDVDEIELVHDDEDC
jgi:hypothetical protein